VVAEARALGVPIVCLTRGGPPLLAGPEGASVDNSGDLHEITRRLRDAALTSPGGGMVPTWTGVLSNFTSSAGPTRSGSCSRRPSSAPPTAIEPGLPPLPLGGSRTS
jgi:hypothetical protein